MQNGYDSDTYRYSDVTFESPNIPSYDIIVENENMLYKHVKCDLVKSKI